MDKNAPCYNSYLFFSSVLVKLCNQTLSGFSPFLVGTRRGLRVLIQPTPRILLLPKSLHNLVKTLQISLHRSVHLLVNPTLCVTTPKVQDHGIAVLINNYIICFNITPDYAKLV